MVLVNYAGKEINAKLVYYGPGLSGKTTNLEYIYTSVPATHRGKMVSMKTKTERTLFFDFLPLDLGELGGYRTRFLLYTVPGQVYYNATRKLVLKGVDAVVFVADSKRAKMDENRESLQNLRDNLKELGLDLEQVPWVLQYNKRDLPDAASIDELNRALNVEGVPAILAVASRGDGVFDTFREVSKLLLRNLSKNLGPSVLAKPAVRPVVPAPQAPRAAAPGRVEAPPHVAMPPRAAVEPPRVLAEPPRVIAEPPRAIVESPRVLAESPRAAVEPPRVIAEPPRAAVEPPRVIAEPPRAAVEPPLVFKMPPRAIVEPPRMTPEPPEAAPPVERDEPRVEIVTMRSEVEAAPRLQPEAPALEAPRKEADGGDARFIVSDPPMRSETPSEHAFAPTIEPARESEAPRPPVPHLETAQTAPEPVMPVAAEAPPADDLQGGRKENGKTENGRGKGGFFGWLRRSRNGQEIEQPQRQREEVEAVPSVISGPVDTHPGKGEGEELLTAMEPVMDPAAEPATAEPAEPFMEMATEPVAGTGPLPAMEIEPEPQPAERETRPHLELLRGTGATAGASQPEAGPAPSVPVHEITVPVELPAGCGEVRLVVRLLVSRTAQEPEVLEPGFEEPRALRVG